MTTATEDQYVKAVRAALESATLEQARVLARWITHRCPECDETPESSDDMHVTHWGAVLVGCEGFHVINPNAVGVASPHWEDWTRDHRPTFDDVAAAYQAIQRAEQGSARARVAVAAWELLADAVAAQVGAHPLDLELASIEHAEGGERMHGPLRRCNGCGTWTSDTTDTHHELS